LESFKLHFATDNFNDTWRKITQIYWLQGREFDMYHTLARQGIKEIKKEKRCVPKQRKSSIGMPDTFFSSASTRLPSCLQCKPKLGASWDIHCARISYIHVHTSKNNSNLDIKIKLNHERWHHAIYVKTLNRNVARYHNKQYSFNLEMNKCIVFLQDKHHRCLVE
jgi:hypothetical protein